MIELSGIHRSAANLADTAQLTIERAIACMKSNRARGLTLDLLAEQLDCDRFHLSHIFTKQVGINLKRFHQLIRLGSAKAILARSNVSITEVAMDCGYDSLGSFVSMFKTAVGLTPSDFRAQFRLIEAGILTMPRHEPQFVERSALSSIGVHLSLDHEMSGHAFVAACHLFDGTVLNCAAFPVDSLSSNEYRTALPVLSEAPVIVLAVVYPAAAAALTQALIDEPPLRGRSNAIVDYPNGLAQAAIPLRGATPFDPPIVSALPMMLLKQHMLSAKRVLKSSTPRRAANVPIDSADLNDASSHTQVGRSEP